MIITIDGPVASGKTSVARSLAQAAGLWYVSSGMLYRALAYIAHIEYGYDEMHQDRASEAVIQDIAARLSYQLDQQRVMHVLYDDRDITSQLKSFLIDTLSSLLSRSPHVREQLRVLQRRLVAGNKAVVEGRDAGTVVFPNAICKIFLNADQEIRAQRWQQDQARRGTIITLEESRAAIHDRDYKDVHREHGSLRVAEDAWQLDTTYLTLDEIVQVILQHLRDQHGLSFDR